MSGVKARPCCYRNPSEPVGVKCAIARAGAVRRLALMNHDVPLPAEPRPGLYRHYKGNDYRVISLAHHSETREVVVVYQALYGERGFWVRPAAMFAETVEVGGRRVPRFARVGD